MEPSNESPLHQRSRFLEWKHHGSCARKNGQPADVAKALGSFDKLAGAHEDNEHHDLTFVYNINGWDARLVALGTTASQLAGESGMPPGALYALFRAGPITSLAFE